MLIGLVGKPSSGKSTFFKACTLAEVAISQVPFTTIKPNHGVGFVRVDCIDKEFNVRCNPRFGYCINNTRFVPVDMMDVAGLVPGAHEGKGLGNQFLDDLRQADVLIHIVDASGSTNEKGELVKPLSYDPCKDVKFLEHELDMWYFQIMKKGWEKFARTVQQENQNIKKALAKQLSGLKVTEIIVEESIKKLKLLHHPIDWTDDDLKNLAIELRKKTKPMIIAANKIDIEGAKLNLDRLQQEFKDYNIIPCSAESELALREAAKKSLIKYIPGQSNFELIGNLNDKQKNALEYIKKNVLGVYGNSGIQEILDFAVFKLLKYIAIFPGGVNKLQDSEGKVLPDCFLMPENSTTLDFAFKIHTDIGNNFVKAIDVKRKMPVGKDYKLKHRDVIEIMT
ncbi:MAG: redox-regulated ATPase YchF [Nanoarchaeota archaeon]